MRLARPLARLVIGAHVAGFPNMPAGPAQDAVDRAKWALAQSKAQTLAHEAGPARQAGDDDLDGLLSDAARLLRTRPPGDAPEWTAEHAPKLHAAVTTGAELTWRGHAQRVATEADPATRRAIVEAPSRRLSRRQ